MLTALERIQSKYSSCAELLDLIQSIHEEIASLPLDEFFEPVNVVIERPGQQKTSIITPELLVAWTRHIAYATRVRMRALEPAIFSELAGNRILGSMVLIRSHMEAAARCAFCEETLMECRHSNDFSPIGELYLKTLFGTSMKHEAKKNEQVKELLTFSEDVPIKITEAIEAMDKFAGGTATNRRRLAYSLLCEYSHPNQRGTKSFQEVVSENENGWIIKYSEEERVSESTIVMALEWLLDNMRIGYGTAELLRLSRFEQTDNGIILIKPCVHEGARIWERIMQLPFDFPDRT
jgi:hypothetical protein